MITDGHVTPLAVLLTGGNRNNVTQLLPLLDSIPPVPGRVGRPRRKPYSLFADRGYDRDIYRDQVRARGIVPAIARRGTLHGTGLGTYRCVVERSFAWLHGVPTSSDPLGTQGRHPQSISQARLPPHHPPADSVPVLPDLSTLQV
ncbi:transposase [Streptomyces sp. 3330]|nr:transposase [Streptomyces sp. 3330]